MDEDRHDGGERSALIKGHVCAAFMRAAALAAVLILVDSYLFGALTVPDNDMFPQIRAGDLVLYYKQGDPCRKDAVVYRASNSIKAGRITAAPGDIVEKTDSGMLAVNGILQTVQEREGIFCETGIISKRLIYPIKLNEDEYFILGDNRNSAVDSRTTGMVRRGDIKGVIFIVIRRQGV